MSGSKILRSLVSLVILVAGCASPNRVPEAPAATVVVAPATAGDAPIESTVGSVRFVKLSESIYADAETTPSEREALVRDYDDAKRHLSEKIGSLRFPSPIAIHCKTKACAALYQPAGRSRVVSLGEIVPWGVHRERDRPAVLVTFVGGDAKDVLAHEMAHIEFGGRARPGSMPSWFNEGLVIWASNAPTCPPGAPLGVDDLRRLDDQRLLGDYTNRPGMDRLVYCQARAEVEAWVAKHGAPNLVAIADGLHAGRSFEDLYGPMENAGGSLVPIVTSTTSALSRKNKPFSIALWMKPGASGGVLAHVSTHPLGIGWCTPLLGYDADGHLVAQLLHGSDETPASFSIARDDGVRGSGAWSHVAMTFAPSGALRLYVDGALAAETRSARFSGPPESTATTISWGSTNAGGFGCWRGAIQPSPFRGKLTEMRVFDTELRPAEIKQLAADRP